MTSSLDWNRLLNRLAKLQVEWEGKIGQSVEQDPGWAEGVAAGILMGRNRLAEEGPIPLNKLNALLDDWERISKTKPDGTIPQSQHILKGIDYGIHLVAELVRRCFELRRRKPPASADNGKARQENETRRGFRS